MAIVVRTDLGMGKGKTAAQVAHAAVSAVLRNWGSPPLAEWLSSGQPKIILRVPSEPALIEVREAAAGLGISVTEIHDGGLTQLAPGTLTCCAVGPAPAPDVDRACGHLPLL